MVQRGGLLLLRGRREEKGGFDAPEVPLWRQREVMRRCSLLLLRGRREKEGGFDALWVPLWRHREVVRRRGLLLLGRRREKEGGGGRCPVDPSLAAQRGGAACGLLLLRGWREEEGGFDAPEVPLWWHREVKRLTVLRQQ